MIRHVRGNLLETNDTFIAHGCNAHGVMGAGVAAAIRAQWPEVYKTYRDTMIDKNWIGNTSALGEIIPAPINSQIPPAHVVLNCITQVNFGAGTKLVSYDAVDKSMERIASEFKNDTNFGYSDILGGISMPKIGAGLGGGQWGVIEEIIKHHLNGISVTVWSF